MLRNTRMALLLLTLAPACSGGARERADGSAAADAAVPAAATSPAATTSRALPASPAATTSLSTAPAGAGEQVRRIEAEVARIDALTKSPGHRLQLFAQVGEDGRLVPVKDTLSWPKELDASINVLRDDGGRVRLLYESPLSQSGDWQIEYLHYFDEQGRLMLFERASGFFNGCPGGFAHERTRRFYAPSGQLLEQTYELKNGEGAPIDSSACAFPYRMPYTIHPSWSAAAKALALAAP